MQNQNREIINPDKLFQVDGFSHAVIPKGNKTVYISGQLGWDENFQIVSDDLAKQTAKAYENIQHVLDELDATWDHVVKTTIYTTKPEQNEMIAGVKQEFLKGIASPAETMIGVAGLASPDCLIEIEAIAVI